MPPDQPSHIAQGGQGNIGASGDVNIGAFHQHLSPTAPAASPPRHLPRAAEHFTGRGPETEWLVKTLPLHPRTALLGPGGIGKTAIAHAALAALCPEPGPSPHFPGGIYFHDFYRAPGHLAIIETLLIQAGLGDTPDAQREETARHLLHGPRCCVALEGCEKAEDLPRFLDLAGPAHLLITTRHEHDCPGTQFRKVPALPAHEAAQLLRQHAASARDGIGAGRPGIQPLPGESEPVWQHIAELLGRHALALGLAGFRLGTQPDTPQEFLTLLRTAGFEHFDTDRRQKQSLDLLFTHSAEILTPEARQCWYVLTLHALAPLPLAPIAACLGLPDTQTRHALDELAAHSLADSTRIPAEIIGTTEPAWQLPHALLSEWGRAKLPVPPFDPAPLHERWVKWWDEFWDRCFDQKALPGGPDRY